jgi:hypothetical protein
MAKSYRDLLDEALDLLDYLDTVARECPPTTARQEIATKAYQGRMKLLKKRAKLDKRIAQAEGDMLMDADCSICGQGFGQVWVESHNADPHFEMRCTCLDCQREDDRLSQLLGDRDLKTYWVVAQ